MNVGRRKNRIAEAVPTMEAYTTPEVLSLVAIVWTINEAHVKACIAAEPFHIRAFLRADHRREVTVEVETTVVRGMVLGPLARDP